MTSAPLPRVPGEHGVGVRIVGIGASAGGLPALEQFLSNVPPHSGLAYVVVQHLDPTLKAVLAELLQRATTLPVREVVARMPVEPDCVYVIAPNTELSVSGGLLQLAKPSEPRGMRLPINVLFSSLARDQGASAIGVVLSGMGSDGTPGLQAIKAVGGLCVVQEPDSAQFDSMPRSAIAAECADIVDVPAAMPARILALTSLDHPTAAANDVPALAAAPALDVSPAQALQDIFQLLLQRTRHDFSLYKPSTVHRRIGRRLAIHGLATLADYARFLRANVQEIDLLFKELLIGVTEFFRDAAAWQTMRDTTIPALLARRATETRLRAWVVGCSTGEEAYTLAMVFAEAVHSLPEHRHCSLQIFASDLSPDAIATARLGRYPAAARANLSPDRLARFFTLQNGLPCVSKSIRDTVLFTQHDVVLDPPFTKLDILCCRNVLIYFNATLQRRLLPLFHYSLRPGGILLLGNSETVGPFNRLFDPIESKLRIYQRQSHATATSPDFLLKSFPPLSQLTKEPVLPTSSSPPAPPDSMQSAAERVLLEVHSPPAVVVNADGDIVFISGRTGLYLEPASGKANWNFHAMVHENLRLPLADALKRVETQSEPVYLHNLPLQTTGGARAVDITVQALRGNAALQGMAMIVFRALAPVPGHPRRKTTGAVEAPHAAALEQLRDEIQTLREETRASKEELQSANEELQSTNEELQSANEELTTSKEEMQSMNEELQTVNTEMQAKLDDLALAQSDMKNLLNSTNIAMLFLDQALNVRRFTDGASKIINLRESDIGRPLSHLTTRLQYPQLHEDALETLRTLVFSEKQITSTDQRWFSVRIMPYRRLDNVIDGAVITFVDITATKQLESTLRKAAQP